MSARYVWEQSSVSTNVNTSERIYSSGHAINLDSAAPGAFPQSSYTLSFAKTYSLVNGRFALVDPQKVSGANGGGNGNTLTDITETLDSLDCLVWNGTRYVYEFYIGFGSNSSFDALFFAICSPSGSGSTPRSCEIAYNNYALTIRGEDYGNVYYGSGNVYTIAQSKGTGTGVTVSNSSSTTYPLKYTYYLASIICSFLASSARRCVDV